MSDKVKEVLLWIVYFYSVIAIVFIWSDIIDCFKFHNFSQLWLYIHSAIGTMIMAVLSRLGINSKD